MLEVILLAGYVFIFSPLFVYLNVPPIWIFTGIVIFSLPGLFAMITGAPFVPTKKTTLRTMMELAEIKANEQACDLGCGDGRLVFAAAKSGAHAIGYELSVPTYLLAKFRSLFYRNSQITYANFWHEDYSTVDVIFCFLLTEPMQRFYKEIWPQLKPGCRVVSHAFKIKDLEPAAKIQNVVMYVK